MYSLKVHHNARADLQALRDQFPEAATQIATLLQEIKTDQDLLDRLTDHDFGASRTADFHVNKWLQQWNRGRDLWRLKIWDLEDKELQYRIVYAYVPTYRTYYVLGVCDRSFDYDENSELTRRILAAYDDLP
ncbi:hypothetical protein H0Z60_04945 [Ectothiorhodospiraceae bacterium WFHF3C12]|nr:hypothetical protein [Ectothiorhodospiraceae bacterium WFHF3C12]